MTKERMKEILVNVVNYVAVANNTSGQIEELLKYGFEAPELAEFGYSKADIEAVTGESCEINNEEEPKELETGAFVLTTHYSFDSDMPVWMFKTEEEARAELERQFKEELRIQTEENEHVEGEDLETDYTEDWDFASISIDFEDTKDVMEWKVSQVRTDKGIGSEIPEPAKEGFMNPPVYDGSDLQKDINTFTKAMEEKYGTIEKISSLQSIMYDFVFGSMVAYKVWNRDNIASAINTPNTPSTYQVSNEDVDVVIDEAIGQLEFNRGIDTLEDCTDEEWNVINDAVKKAMKNVNPKITDTYDYCVKSYAVDGQEVTA